MSPILLHIHESITGELNCLLSILSSCRWNDWHSPAYVFETRTARFEWLYQNPYDCACKRNRPSNSKDDNPEQSVDGVGSHCCWEEKLWYCTITAIICFILICVEMKRELQKSGNKKEKRKVWRMGEYRRKGSRLQRKMCVYSRGRGYGMVQ